jgi:hypothetical protein
LLGIISVTEKNIIMMMMSTPNFAGIFLDPKSILRGGKPNEKVGKQDTLNAVGPIGCLNTRRFE